MRKGFAAVFGGTAVVAMVCLTPPVAALTLGFAAIVARGIAGFAVAAEA